MLAQALVAMEAAKMQQGCKYLYNRAMERSARCSESLVVAVGSVLRAPLLVAKVALLFVERPKMTCLVSL